MSTTDHYDRTYYESRYGHLLRNDVYRRLLGAYWREAIFVANGLDPAAEVLDYGCGLGVVSGSLPNATLHDPSHFAMDFLEAHGRRVLRSTEAIPTGRFDAILSSHSLEHVPEPPALLRRFRELVRPAGHLILILPIESQSTRTPALARDLDQHLYCWTFQTITNLLLQCGWTPQRQAVLHSPFLLGVLGRNVSESLAVRLAVRFGKLKRSYPSMLTVAAAGPP